MMTAARQNSGEPLHRGWWVSCPRRLGDAIDPAAILFGRGKGEPELLLQGSREDAARRVRLHPRKTGAADPRKGPGVKRTVSSAILCTAPCRRSPFLSWVRNLERGPAVFLPTVPASLLHLHY